MLLQPCLIAVTMLYPYTTVLFIDLLCAPLISVSLLAPTVSMSFHLSQIQVIISPQLTVQIQFFYLLHISGKMRLKLMQNYHELL